MSSDDAQDKRAAVLATLQAMEAVEADEGAGGMLLGPGAHYVSKTWLQGGWLAARCLHNEAACESACCISQICGLMHCCGGGACCSVHQHLL